MSNYQYKSKNSLSEGDESLIIGLSEIVKKLGGSPPWFISIRNSKPVCSIEIKNGIVVEIDSDGRVIDIECMEN